MEKKSLDVNLTNDTNATNDMNISKLFSENLPTHEDFEACYNQNEKSFVNLYGVDALAVDKHHAISFEKPQRYLKYDSVLGLYLLHSKELLQPPKRRNKGLKEGETFLGSLTKERIAFGKFKSFGTSFNGFDKLFFEDRRGSMITDGCCYMHGIGKGKRNFIPNRYINFLLDKDSFHGDIGISYYNFRGGVRISSTNPYKAKDFCIGDEIVSVNDIPITSRSQLAEIILFAKRGKKLTLHVKRAGKMRVVEVMPYERPKYLYRDSTYLKQTGMNFGKNLVLTSVKKDSFAYKKGLEKGDRLMEINFVPVKTTDDARRALYKARNRRQHLLFTRHDFQFFINIDESDKGVFIELPNCPAL